MPGDPALRVVGKQEKSARIHKPMPPKPKRAPTLKSIRYDIKWRMQEIEPLVNEYWELERFLALFDTVIREVRGS
jgi:hypothetical protein